MIRTLILTVMMTCVCTAPCHAFVMDNRPLVIANFECCPNNLGGTIGVYGSLEPDWADKTSPYSWFYAPETPGYNRVNVHSGKQSFRLVNGLGSKKAETWGSFSMDLGPVLDASTVPIKVNSKDITGYRNLSFWVKGEKGGEKMDVVFRDSHATSYMPQGRYKVEQVTTTWQKITIPVSKIRDLGIDIRKVDNVGIAFGPDVGNQTGATVYLDDFEFTND